MKFDFKYLETKIALLDVLVYKNINNELQEIDCRKPRDYASYLQAIAEYPRLLKESIAYMQSLYIKKACEIFKT